MPWYAWVIGIGVNLAVVGALVAWARRSPAGRRGDSGTHCGRRAALLGAAGGTTFGLTAALMKGMTGTLAAGFGAVLSGWQLYGMIAAGVGGMFLVQSAMNAGRLLAAQPGLTLSDPPVSILWGVLAFGEQVRTGWYLLLAVLSGLVMAGAVVFLARSPLLSGPAANAEATPRDQGVTAARRTLGTGAGGQSTTRGQRRTGAMTWQPGNSGSAPKTRAELYEMAQKRDRTSAA